MNINFRFFLIFFVVYKAHLKRRSLSISIYGNVYISQHYVCFRGKALGHTTKEIIPLTDVTTLEIHENTLFLGIDKVRKEFS